MSKLTLTLPVLAVAAAFGCSSPSRTVSGTLDLTQMRPSNAQVIAISSTGRVFRAPIAASGAFSISLPTQSSYTIRFANATNVTGRYDAFATLAPHRTGATTHWFTLTSGAAVQLGRVARVGTGLKAAGGLSTLSDGADDGSDSDSAGESEQEDDGAEACDLSGGQDDADVESEHDVNDDVDSDHDGKPDSVDDSDDRATCATTSSDGCKLSDDESKELDDDADKSCTAGGGGTGTPTPAPGLAP